MEKSEFLEGVKSVVDVLNNEIEFYKEKENPSWSSQKNDGFHEGVKYCHDLIMSVYKDDEDVVSGKISL
ncbi:hypothetical protein DMC16_14945 [Lacticaseibacillus paracasei]|uniref:hypothetical protein n=1 Tax=Lacticaseibacillus paracasei TaxID=1597 RepID=UPI000D760E14|nr:hypothetical protein [Lacticaseibacillus paracasei]AWR92316.1 hypothetical protein DMC16_14945 [Lacticaseibacillus paracasei]